MATIEYVEDALEKFLEITTRIPEDIDWKDHTILSSLLSAVMNNGALTQKQAYLVLKILSKYQHLTSLSFDLISILSQPKWRSNFRTLDMTRSISVQNDEEGTLWIIMKFPYALIKEFEEKLVTETNQQEMKWCSITKVRKLKFYEFNTVVIDEFVRQHNFVIDDSFIDALNRVEEIWQQQESIQSYSVIKDSKVVLVNAANNAQEYFQTHVTGDIDRDLFLAKSMGFPTRLERAPNTIIEKIAQDPNSHFWMKTNREFLQLYKTVGATTALVLDRNTENIINWLDQFISDAKAMGINVNEFRVCHRESKDSRVPLNDWIKENNLGGSVKDGKLFIFKQKPAKWLFSDNIDVKIIGTNSYTPVNEMSALCWMQSHPCVCYISDIKPTKIRNRQIAHL
jgi:hypothetical protein